MAVDIYPGKKAYNIIWNIGKIKPIVSQTFDLENSKWRFLLEIEINTHQNEEDWKMYMNKINPKDGNHVFLVSVYAEDRFKKLECLNFMRLTFQRSGIEQIMWRRKSNIIKKYPDMKIDDMNFVITILADHQNSTAIKSFTDSKTTQTPSYMEVRPCLESLSDDFGKLKESGSEPDLEVRCGGNTIHVHKAVLIARSKVFAAMLQNDMLEKSKGFIEIVDMEYSAVEIFVRYLYTGTFPKTDIDIIAGLYEAADKYAVDALKIRTGLFLKENLTAENACRILVLADTHCDKNLKEYVTSYMIQNDILMYMEDGQKFCSLYPKLAVDVLYQAYKIVKTAKKNEK